MSGPDAPKRKLKRPVISEHDGMHEGGLVFCVTLIAGFVLSNIVVPGAAASFWIWVVLLVVSMGIAVNVQQGIRAFFARRLPEDPSDQEEPSQA